jgi:hypothetical protein
MSNYEKNVYRSPQSSRQESGDSHPSQASITQIGTQKPSVHYHEDVISPPATGSYFAFPKSESRQSSDDEDEEDEFDWSGDEDLNNEEAKFEKKMGVKIKSRGWGIIRYVCRGRRLPSPIITNLTDWLLCYFPHLSGPPSLQQS